MVLTRGHPLGTPFTYSHLIKSDVPTCTLTVTGDKAARQVKCGPVGARMNSSIDKPQVMRIYMNKIDIVQIVLGPVIGIIFLVLILKYGERKPEEPRYFKNVKWVSRKDNCFYIYYLALLPFCKYANVGIVNDGLLISRFGRNVTVRFGDIESVRSADSVRDNTYHLVIRFKNKSGFGREINFFAVNHLIEGELLSLLKSVSS